MEIPDSVPAQTDNTVMPGRPSGPMIPDTSGQLAPGQEPSTDETLVSELSAGEHSGVVEDYSFRSPYAPETYKCSGYGGEQWEHFDGSPERDCRFTIDLERGTMDRLKDVRPYLYYVGFYSAPSSQVQPEVEKLPPAEVEDAYFLAKRDWSVYNTERFYGWPFQALCHGADQEGDVGFEYAHDDEQYEEDCLGCVVKTNIRSPLPIEGMITTHPDDPKWDTFIHWIYEAEIHGALFSMKGWPSENIRYNRAMRGLGGLRVGWLTKEAVDELT